MNRRKWIHTSLSILFIFHLYGCATPAAVKYAEKLAKKPKIFKKMLRVHPVAFRTEENVEICVTLSCGSSACEDEDYLLFVPVESLNSGKTSPEKMDFLIDRHCTDPYLPVYWFPVDKPSESCAEIVASRENSATHVYLEILYLYSDKWEYLYKGQPQNENEVYSVLHNYNEGIFSGGSVYALKIVNPEDLTVTEVFLTYFPVQDQNRAVGAMGLIGGYHDPSTQAGYVLVPFAIAFDIALVVVAAAVVVLGVFAGAYDSIQ